MKKRKKLHTASVLSAVLMAGAVMNATPAFASISIPTASTTPAAGTTTTFDKYLVMKKNANVPNATFSYTVSIPTDDEMNSLPNPEDTNGTNLTVRKGIGSPTASDTKFTAGDQTFDSAQTARTNTSSVKTTDLKEDQVTLDENHKYAKHTSTVDFSNVTFSEPGVYRYKITENVPTENDPKEKGIGYDTTARYLDVYVQSDDDGNLSIQGYVFHTANEAQKKDGTNPKEKNKGFTNTYTTQDLTLTKIVKGNQGYRDQYFKFHVDITNLDVGAVLSLTDKDGGQFPQDNIRVNETTIPTASAVTANDEGKVSFDVYLKHNDSLKINGLTEGAKYTIKETSEDYSATATKTVTGTDGAQEIKLDHNATDHTDATPTGNNELTLGANDETVTFTNDREGTLPTGIYHNNHAAFNIMGIAAAGGAIAIVIRKRRKSTEQALKNLNK